MKQKKDFKSFISIDYDNSYRPLYSGGIFIRSILYNDLHSKDESKNALYFICEVSFSFFDNDSFAGLTEHLWKYDIVISENCKEPKIIDSKCAGGVWYSDKSRQIDILQNEENFACKLMKDYLYNLLIIIYNNLYKDISIDNISRRYHIYFGHNYDFAAIPMYE